MDPILSFLMGPLLTFAVAILILGLLRHAALSIWALIDAVRRAGDRRVPFAQILCNTASWVYRPLICTEACQYLASRLSLSMRA